MKCECFNQSDSKPHSVIEKYIVVNKLHHLYLEKELNRSGVFRSQHQLLMYISRFPDASQKEIANHHHVSTATIAVSLKKLEKGGYISKDMDQNDNRFNQIRITEKGKTVVESSKKVFKKVENAMYASFTEEELLQFETFLDRVKLNMEALFQDSGYERGEDCGQNYRQKDKPTDRQKDRQ